MNAINPGTRDMVDWLQSQGLTTIDSGDGQTRDYECDREHPYVAVLSSAPVITAWQLHTVLTRELVGITTPPGSAS